MGTKVTIFALLYFVFEGKFQVQAPPPPRGAYIGRGDLTEGFLSYVFGGLIFEILRYLTMANVQVNDKQERRER